MRALSDVGDNDEIDPRLKLLKMGSEVEARVINFSPLGANVEVILSGEVASEAAKLDVSLSGQLLGLIRQLEIGLFREARGGDDVEIGDVLHAWVHNVRQDGKIDLGLRPAGRSRVTAAQADILRALEQPGSGGKLAVGDKSDPLAIRRVFPGISKKQFKDAVGALFRQGIVRPSAFSLELVPELERASVAAEVESRGRRPSKKLEGGEGWRSSTPSDRSRVKQARVPAGVDAVLVTGINYKTTAEALTAFLERGVAGKLKEDEEARRGGRGVPAAAAARVLRVTEMVGQDGRPSGRAVVTFKPPKLDAPSSSSSSSFSPPPAPRVRAPLLLSDQDLTNGGGDHVLLEQASAYATTAVRGGGGGGLRGPPPPSSSSGSRAKASAALFEELSALTVPQLKELLKAKKLRVGGLKAELVERLVEEEEAAAAASLPGTSVAGGDEAYDDDLPGVALSPEDSSEPLTPHATRARQQAAESSSSLEEAMQKVVAAACQLDGASLNGRNLRVRPYYPQRPSSSASPGLTRQRTDARRRAPLFEDDEEESDYEGEEGAAGGGYDDFKDSLQERGSASRPSSGAQKESARGGGREHQKRAEQQGKARHPSQPQRPCVYFGNLAYGQDMQELGTEIEAVCGPGTVLEIRPSPYGDYAHVDFSSSQAAQAAVRELNSVRLMNRPLRVDFAR